MYSLQMFWEITPMKLRRSRWYMYGLRLKCKCSLWVENIDKCARCLCGVLSVFFSPYYVKERSRLKYIFNQTSQPIGDIFKLLLFYSDFNTLKNTLQTDNRWHEIYHFVLRTKYQATTIELVALCSRALFHAVVKYRTESLIGLNHTEINKGRMFKYS